MHVVLVVSLVVAGWTIAADAEVIQLDPNETGLVFVAGDNEVIQVQVSELRLDRIEIDGSDWAVVKVAEAQNSMHYGLPSLPYLAGEYLLGRSDAIALELVSVTTRDIALDNYGFAGVAPSKGHFDRGTDPATIPWVFEDKIYGGDARFPTDDVRIDQPFIAGPLRGQAFRVPVAFWRPDTNILMVVEEAAFRVVSLPEGANPRLGPDRPMTGLFDGLARQYALNYDTVRGRYIPFVETGRLLILADDDFVDEAQPLADWEALVGYPTLLVPVSAAGTTGAQIKSYIQSLYDAPDGLTWIILIGDAQQHMPMVRQQRPCVVAIAIVHDLSQYLLLIT
jgi:hypothetical protein